MAVSRPRYNSVDECPKCGLHQSRGFRTEYCSNGLQLSGKPVDEHLVRTCTRCEYDWEEACLDA